METTRPNLSATFCASSWVEDVKRGMACLCDACTFVLSFGGQGAFQFKSFFFELRIIA